MSFYDKINVPPDMTALEALAKHLPKQDAEVYSAIAAVKGSDEIMCGLIYRMTHENEPVVNYVTENLILLDNLMDLIMADSDVRKVLQEVVEAHKNRQRNEGIKNN